MPDIFRLERQESKRLKEYRALQKELARKLARSSECVSFRRQVQAGVSIAGNFKNAIEREPTLTAYIRSDGNVEKRYAQTSFIDGDIEFAQEQSSQTKDRLVSICVVGGMGDYNHVIRIHIKKPKVVMVETRSKRKITLEPNSLGSKDREDYARLYVIVNLQG